MLSINHLRHVELSETCKSNSNHQMDNHTVGKNCENVHSRNAAYFNAQLINTHSSTPFFLLLHKPQPPINNFQYQIMNQLMLPSNQ